MVNSLLSKSKSITDKETLQTLLLRRQIIHLLNSNLVIRNFRAKEKMSKNRFYVEQYKKNS